MKDELTEKLGDEFWSAIALLALFAVGTGLSVWFENFYGASIFGLFLCLNVYRLIYHIRRARLARGLQKDPELKRIYDARNQ